MSPALLGLMKGGGGAAGGSAGIMDLLKGGMGAGGMGSGRSEAGAGEVAANAKTDKAIGQFGDSMMSGASQSAPQLSGGGQMRQMQNMQSMPPEFANLLGDPRDEALGRLKRF